MAGLDLSRLAFHRPELLWLLAGAALVLLIRTRAARGLGGADRARSFLSMWGRIGAYGSLCLAAAGPYTTEDRPDLALGLVVDATGSSAGGRLERYVAGARAFYEAALAGGEGTRPVVVSVGAAGETAGVAVGSHADLDALAEEVRVAGDAAGTDLEAAIEEAIRALPAARSRALLLFTDGAQTRGELDRVAALASARDVRIHPFPPDAGRTSVAVGEVVAAQDRRVGDRIPVKVRLAANAAARGTLVLKGKGDREMARREGVEVGPGDTWVPLEVAAPDEAGVMALRAEIAFPGDHFASDDALPALVRVEGAPRALLVGDAGQAGPLREALEAAEPPLVVDLAPGGRRAPYEGYDLVALLDPDLPATGEAGSKAMRDWVRRGGRLVVTGGAHGLVVDKPGQEAMAEVLPLRFPKTEREEPAPLAVVYCVDRSDSMARYGKFDIALTAVAESVRLLEPESEVGVLTFSDFPKWAVPLAEVGEDRGPVLDKLAGLQIHGGTSIFPALEAAYEALKGSKAIVRHAILLTDGRSTTVYERHGAVVDTFRNAGMSLSTVGISKEADSEQLQKIADVGGGRYYFTEDLRSVPRIVMDETMKVMRTNKVDETFRVHAVPGSRFLAGVDTRGIPELRGYVRSHQKAGSELALATERGEPLLVGWRFGRGAVTAFTSDVAGPWSGAWKGWPGRRALWRQVVKETLAPPPPPRLSLTADVEGGEARIVFSALDLLGAPLNDLTLEGRATGIGGGTSALAFVAVGPGRYGATLALPPESAFLVEVAAVGAGAAGVAGAELRLSVAAEHPEEARGGTLNLGALEGLARATGGRISPSPDEVLRQGVEVREVQVERWRPLVWLAFALMLVDLSIRRLRIPGRA
ncbi:VWA domain-containing protein [Myxococcota bacterium]|nr:VWA domain-containing protein [Myxococcota bacterium]